MPRCGRCGIPLAGLLLAIGSALIPILTQVIKVFNEDLLPPIKDIARTLGPVLMPILKAFYGIFAGNIKTVLVVIADVLKVVGPGAHRGLLPGPGKRYSTLPRP